MKIVHLHMTKEEAELIYDALIASYEDLSDCIDIEMLDDIIDTFRRNLDT